MVTGKNNTNKSYKLGAQYAILDFSAGLERRLTSSERFEACKSGLPVQEYRPMKQPRGFYGSEMERGYQETWASLQTNKEAA